MTKIYCHALICTNNSSGVCIAKKIELSMKEKQDGNRLHLQYNALQCNLFNTKVSTYFLSEKETENLMDEMLNGEETNG